MTQDSAVTHNKADPCCCFFGGSGKYNVGFGGGEIGITLLGDRFLKHGRK